MAKHRYTNLICVLVTVCMLALTGVLMMLGGDSAAAVDMPYAQTLFDETRVHSLDIVVDADDWQGILDNPSAKEYIACNVVVDGEAVKNVGIRTKGNSSLSMVQSSDSDRYSFKLEFDHYVDGRTYQGLDKLALNNISQDSTYLKDYLCYQLMNEFGAYAPLCSFIWITVNGEDWGLYLAVEGIEESFLQRTVGNDMGNLYKPDSMDMNDRGNRDDDDRGGMEPAFEMPEGIQTLMEDENVQKLMQSGELFTLIESGDTEKIAEQLGEDAAKTLTELMSGEGMPFFGGMGTQAEDDAAPEDRATSGSDTQSDNAAPGQANGGGQRGGGGGGGGFGGFGGNNDVALIYTDDDPDSYPNIFDNATLDASDADQARLIEALRKLNAGEDIEDVVNVDEVLRYFVVHNFVLNFDSYTGSMTHNYYLHEKDGQLSMIAWDYNLSFGTFAMGGGMGGGGGSTGATSVVNFPIDTPTSGATLSDRPMLNVLLSDETYLAQYHELFDTFLREVFEEGDFFERYDAVVDMISPYVERDPSAFVTYEQFQTGTATLREFLELRVQSVRGQLDGTIPATSEGQAENPDALIDASHINTSDTGSQNGGFGGGGFGRARDQGTDTQTGTSPPAAPGGDTTAADASGSAVTMPADMPGDMPFPGMDGGTFPEGMPDAATMEAMAAGGMEDFVASMAGTMPAQGDADTVTAGDSAQRLASTAAQGTDAPAAEGTPQRTENTAAQGEGTPGTEGTATQRTASTTAQDTDATGTEGAATQGDAPASGDAKDAAPAQGDVPAADGTGGTAQTQTAPAAPAQDEGAQAPAAQNGGGARSWPGGMGGGTTTQKSNAEQYILLGISAGVLILGILFAWLYGRRRR